MRWKGIDILYMLTNVNKANTQNYKALIGVIFAVLSWGTQQTTFTVDIGHSWLGFSMGHAILSSLTTNFVLKNPGTV